MEDVGFAYPRNSVACLRPSAAIGTGSGGVGSAASAHSETGVPCDTCRSGIGSNGHAFLAPDLGVVCALHVRRAHGPT
jgi:hypothetical protein